MKKPAPVDHPIHRPLAERWSPRAFASRAVSVSDWASLFEAARWAPSSMNEQPWGFVLAERSDSDAFARVLRALASSNQRWASHAGGLIVATARTTHARNGAPNRYAWHDTGLAVAQLIVEATARGLATHPMGGFDAAALRQAAELPEGVDPVLVLAVGHPDELDALPEGLQARESAPRQRRPLAEQVFAGTWGRGASFAAPPDFAKETNR